MRFSILLTLLLLLSSVTTQADRLLDIMRGYDAKTMTVEEMDEAMRREGDSAPHEATNYVGGPTSVRGERYRLEYKNEQKVFRHSFFADYYLIDTYKNDTIALCDEPVRDAAMSPNGKYVVYAKKDHNLYIYKIDFKTEVAITHDVLEDAGSGYSLEAKRKAGDIYNGISDWLYEEEFGITQLFAFSPDSKHIAFVRLNEKEVPTFEWQTYLRPLTYPSPKEKESVENATSGYSLEFKDKGLYPELHSLRYPKAGEANAKAEVCVYDIHYKTIRTMQLPSYADGYVPRIRWTSLVAPTKKGEEPNCDIVILHLNRDQNRMDVLKGNPKSTICHPFYKEESKKHFVNYEYFDEWQWLSDNRVIILSEKGGYTQAYLYSSQGVEQKQLTPEARDITKVYGYDEKTQTLYYQAATTPTTRHCYALNVTKNTTIALTEDKGTHSLHFSKDWKRCVHCYHSTTTPHKYTLCEVRGGRLEAKGTVLDNDSVLQAWRALGVNEKEFFTIETERGDVLNAWRILPTGFDATKKYPVVMLQYSGPTSQRVLNNWRKRFGYSLADAGYLVVCVDGRGTGARGREWRNATYMQLGVKEAEDQISAALYLKTLPYVDGDRMAICGWSYGGYQALMCLSKQGNTEIWQCGIAIAPVTNWRLYDSAYTERFMRRPQVNEGGYEQTNLIKMADNLEGKLLLIHGLADDNVHTQNSWLYVDALVKAGKQFEMQMYVDDNHSIRKPENNDHLHKRIMLFLENNL